MPTSTETVELSIVMPCLNEAETLALCIDKAQGYLARSGVVGEVIIADNGSTDGSQDIARAHGARVVDVPAKGYGTKENPQVLFLQGATQVDRKDIARVELQSLDAEGRSDLLVAVDV